MRVASIDIGTNTLRLYIGELSSGALKKVCVCREITRLGGGFDRGKGLISEEAIARSLEVLGGFSEMIASSGVRGVRAVATSVVREARNGPEFVRLVREKTGIALDIISGYEEARLTVRGVLCSLEMESGTALIVDVGGGSTEYIYVQDSEIKWIRSLPLGVVHLCEEYLRREGMTGEEDLCPLREHITRVLVGGLGGRNTDVGEDVRLVATAGTPTTLAAIDLGLDDYDPALVNGRVLTRFKIEEILRSLLSLEVSERLALRGLERGREDVIVPGALIVLQTMEEFRCGEVLVSDGGLLEGAALSIL